MEDYKKILNKKLTLMTAFTGFSATLIVLIGAFVYAKANINSIYWYWIRFFIYQGIIQ